jgi:Ni/Co efflux regulator RcnB
MKKIVLGMVAAAIAVPSVASAQPGYYDPYYGRGNYTHPADRNGDGVVTQREARRYERQVNRYNGYNSGYNGYNTGYNGYNSGYTGYNGYNSGYNGYNTGGAYSQYYDRNGYYSGPTWRGNDGRYYCRRSDGTTGTIVGGAAGALIGSQVAGRGDRTLGAIIGGAIGAVIGNSVEKGRNNGYRCN